MISITPVLIESDLCTTTNTFKQLDIQLDSAPIRQALCQQSRRFLSFQPQYDSCTEDCLSNMHV